MGVSPIGSVNHVDSARATTTIGAHSDMRHIHSFINCTFYKIMVKLFREFQMSDKQPISARETYILDEDELDQLDELSLTSVIEDLSGSVRQLQSEPEPDAHALEQPSSGDTTINELLYDAAPLDYSPDEYRPHADYDDAAIELDPPEASDDLIAPDVLFSDQDDNDTEGA